MNAKAYAQRTTILQQKAALQPVEEGSLTPAKFATGIGLWEKNGANLSYGLGNIGIGTTSPQDALQIGDYSLGSQYISIKRLGSYVARRHQIPTCR
ncbi:MAG: hypothetical protein WCO90_08735 [Planctomycetota bacterium]